MYRNEWYCAFLPHSVLAILEYWRVTLGYFAFGKRGIGGGVIFDAP